MPLCKITLPESLDISEVSHFHHDLIEKLNEFDEFEIDDSELINIDTAGAQLLLVLALEIKTNNKTLKWDEPVEVVQTSLDQLSVTDLIIS